MLHRTGLQPAASSSWSLGRLLAPVMLIAAMSASAESELSDAAARGKQIYHQGTTAAGTPVSAVVARGAQPIDAAFIPCAGCHGPDGKGRPEGGVNPPDITWPVLTAPNGHQHDYGRSHAAFDTVSVSRAITTGIDPAGNELDLAMPRYTLDPGDLRDLVAYLESIRDDLDPGLGRESIRLGTLLPVEEPLRELGTSMRAVLEAAFADINEQGGIHGRRLELVVGELGTDALRNGWSASDFLRDSPVFALVSGYLPGIEQQVSAIAEEDGVPLIGPYTLAPGAGDGSQRMCFFLLGGVEQQARVLVRHAAMNTRADTPRLAVVHPTGSLYEASAAAVGAEAEDIDWEVSTAFGYRAGFFDATDTADLLREQAVTSVVFLGKPDDLGRLAEAGTRLDWTPDLLLPGVFAGRNVFDIPHDYAGRVLIGYSSIPSDHTKQGVAEFERLHRDHEIDYTHATAQISAFVATKILVEGLKRAGRDLSRERLVSELERLADYQPGLMPPISFNSRRRIGALGGYVVSLDLTERRFGPASKWIELRP